MTKDEWTKILENLKDIAVGLINKANEKSNEKPKVFVPELGGNYYIIDTRAKIKCLPFGDDEYDEDCFSIGNCFRTREQAEFALEKQKVYTELKRYALEHNECAIDWGDALQSKCCIRYNYDSNEFEFLFGFKIKNMWTIYFTNEEIASNAINEIGAEKIKKYLFEVRK